MRTSFGELTKIGDIHIFKISINLMGGPETINVSTKVKELAEKGNKKFIFDLSGVAWINQSGMGMILGCQTTIKNKEGRLLLTGVQGKIKNLFVITKLITLIEAYETVDEAIAILEQS